MATITVAAAGSGVKAPQARILHLTLKGGAVVEKDPSAVLADAVDRLYALRDLHITSNDYLSALLHEWVDTVLEVDVEMIETKAKNLELIEEAKRLIRYLRERILVDPLYGCPLTEPLLEDVWVWDMPILAAFQNTSLEIFKTPRESPLSKRPLTDVRPHAFARDVLAWIDSLPDELLLPTIDEIETASVAAVKAGAGGVIEGREVLLPIDPAAMPRIEGLRPPPAILEAMPPDVRSGIERLYVQCLEERLQKIRMQYDNFIRRAENAIVARKLEIQRLEMEKTAEVFESTKEARATLYAEETRAREEMAAAHAAIVTSHITAIREAHAGEVAILATRIDDLMRNLERTRNELQEAYAQIDRDSARIAVLERRNRDYEHQLASLRAEASDGDGCIVM